MATRKFICSGEDKEDLTEKVLEIKRRRQRRSGGSEDKSNKKDNRHWRISVKCSKGHKNIFEGKD